MVPSFEVYQNSAAKANAYSVNVAKFLSSKEEKMREQVITLVKDAINNGKELRITMQSGSNAICVDIVPDNIDVGTMGMIIYSGNNLFDVDLRDVEYDFEEYVCGNSHSVITIS